MKKVILAMLLSASLAGFPACSDSEDDNEDDTPTEPFVGTWVSAGADVASLLDVIFTASGGVDTIIAVFNEDKSYTVKQINGNATVVNYAGTYTLTKSTGSTIHKIVVNQTAPSVATSEGIYQIYTNVSDSMKYEVVLTSGTTNVAPTPTAGFGSTNGGAFGTTNVQKYIRRK